MKRCESRKGAHTASKISFPFWEAVPLERVSLKIQCVMKGSTIRPVLEAAYGHKKKQTDTMQH